VSSKSPLVERKRLSAMPSAATNSSELSRHLLRAQEDERKRISRELHDEAGQGLMALRLYLAMLANSSENPENLLKVQEALGLLDHTIEGLRRVIARLSPRTLDELGLLAAIRKEARRLSKATGMKAQVRLPDILPGIDHDTEVAIYRSVQEALHNVAKHSQAHLFRVHLEADGGWVRLLVEDDGVGMSRRTAARGESFGFAGMRDRIAALGGTVRIRSGKANGTRVTVAVPARSRETNPMDGARDVGVLLVNKDGDAAVRIFRSAAKSGVSASHAHQVHTR
jgi:signal transduction histidine kinase